MTLHQVNQDGAGPYTCQVSTDATGDDFQDMTVTTNVPGIASLSTAKATDFPLVAQMPAGTTCTGGPDGNACLVRCRNSAIAGPFGGCAAVTTSDSSSSNSTSDLSSSNNSTSDLSSSNSTASDSSDAAASTDDSSDATVDDADDSSDASLSTDDTSDDSSDDTSTVDSASTDTATADSAAATETSDAAGPLPGLAAAGKKKGVGAKLKAAGAKIKAALGKKKAAAKGGAGAKGALGKLLGGANAKRMVNSRVVGKRNAGRWM